MHKSMSELKGKREEGKMGEKEEGRKDGSLRGNQLVQSNQNSEL